MKRQFVRDNFLGLSLTLIGVLCLVLAVMLNLSHRQAWAEIEVEMQLKMRRADLIEHAL